MFVYVSRKVGDISELPSHNLKALLFFSPNGCPPSWLWSCERGGTGRGTHRARAGCDQRSACTACCVCCCSRWILDAKSVSGWAGGRMCLIYVPARSNSVVNSHATALPSNGASLVVCLPAASALLDRRRRRRRSCLLLLPQPATPRRTAHLVAINGCGFDRTHDSRQ